MKQKKCSDPAIRILMTASAIFLLMVSQVAAHDWWMNKSGAGYDIVMAHLKADGIEADAYEPDRVVHAAGHRPNGEKVPITIEWKQDRSGAYILPLENFSALTALIYNKYWMKTTRGWRNERLKGSDGVIKEGQSFKYTKHIEQWQNWLAAPLGQEFEIVPLENPEQLRKGESLKVRLIFMGQKVHEARLTQISGTHTLKLLKTDDCFTVAIPREGFQFINAKIEIPVKDRQVIWYSASLTFNTHSR